MKKSVHDRLLDLTFIALFAALCYIALTVLFFPFGPMYIHFGNLIVVLAALLVGGWQGGLAGSIGMGFYDILNGHAESAPKTFLLKLLIGLVAGLVYSLIKKRKKYPALPLLIAGIVSFAVVAGLLVHTFEQNRAYTGKSAYLVPIFAGIGVLCIVFSLLKNRFPQKTAAAIVGASCGMLVNIVGETAWKFFAMVIAGNPPRAALIGAALQQGSTLINAGIAIVGGAALFAVLQKPFAKIRNR